MGSFGGFYKGDKKKQKKGQQGKGQQGGLSSPTFSMPEIISKKKKDY